MAKTTAAKKTDTKNEMSAELPTEAGRLHARGANSQQRVLWAALFAQGLNGRRGLPYVLVGEPGSAKTSSVRQLSAQANLAFEGVLGSLRSPIDFLGVPVPRRMQLNEHTQHLSPDGDAEFTYMHYAPAGFSMRAAMAKRAVILLDEVNTCPPSVQAALLRVLFEGVVGELELPPGVRMLLAMNETKDAAGGWDIAPPLANRMGWIEWSSPTPQEFTKFLLNGGRGVDLVRGADGEWTPADKADPATEEAAVDALWPKAWASAVGEVSGFLHRRAELLLKRGKEGDRQWPSPRTWELTTRALTGSYVYDLSEIEREMACAAFVGSGAFGEFFAWRKEADLPDPEALLDGLVTFKHTPARLDRTAAVLTACTAIVTPDNAPSRKERSGRLWSLIRGMTADATDVCLPSVVALCNARLMNGHPEAYHVLANIEPVMSAAGITKI